MRRAWCVLLAFLLAGCAVSYPPLTPQQSEKMKGFLEAGVAQPKCDAERCDAAFWMQRSALKERYDKGDWVNLAADVVRIGEANELAYYYLGRSAEGLGYAPAAEKYYKKSLWLAQNGRGAQRCSSSFFPCGLPGGKLAAQRLAALGSATGTPTNGGSGAAPAKKTAPWSKPYGVPGSPVTVRELRNATFYNSDFEGRITLKNGRWRNPHPASAENYESFMTFKLTASAVGDIDGDGVPDGAFVVMSQGMEPVDKNSFLYVVLSGKQGHTVSPEADLGDVTFSAKSAFIKDHKIFINAKVLRSDQDRPDIVGGAKLKGRVLAEFSLRNGTLQRDQPRHEAPLLPIAAAGSAPDTAQEAALGSRGGALRKAILNFSDRQHTLNGIEVLHYRNGKSEKRSNLFNKQEIYQNVITNIALGDLNGDKRPDGAFIVVTRGRNGDGDSARLRVMVVHANRGRVICDWILGGFTRVTYLSIRDGVIHLTKLVAEDEGNPYSKKVEVRQRFRVRKGDVEEIGGKN